MSETREYPPGSGQWATFPDLKVGDELTIELPGVPDWKIPPQTLTATVTAENRAALIAEATEAVTTGGGKARIS